MRFINILKCLYRLPEYRETLANTNERLERYLKDTNQRLELYLKDTNQRLDALESYASALTLDRVEPVEAEVKTIREEVERHVKTTSQRLEALDRYIWALTRDRVDPVFASQTMFRRLKQSDGLEDNNPLPEGVESREKVLKMFLSVSIDDAPRKELHSYAETECDRFLHTLHLVRPDAKRILEIGANPYFSSILLKEFRSAKLDFTNYFEPGPERATQSVHYVNHEGKRRKWQVEYSKVNTEEAALPAKDGFYDHVLFCEVLEHLTNDPLFALIEINRVLETGGTLVLSTPNVARLENVAALLSGANIYDPYSGYGPYGRHNREYSCHELNWLLHYTGFEVETFFTLDTRPDKATDYFDVEKLKPLVQFRAQDLGCYMFARAIKRRNVDPSLKRPMWLYRSLGEHRLAKLSLSDDPVSGR